MTTVKKVLAQAKSTLELTRALISDDSHWTTGTSARDKDNVPISSLSASACKFCVTGAMRVVAYDPESLSVALDRLDSAAAALFTEKLKIIGICIASCVAVNDHLGHPRTIQMLDKAIESFA